jgi:penicillin-binding protein 1A
MPEILDNREQLVDPMTAYQMVHILEGVVERGTARYALAGIGRPMAGKTGTSNDSKDTWFAGFSPDLTVVVFVGFDEPTDMGEHETGATAAAPVFRDFMMAALKDKPPVPFRVPPGIRLVRVNAGTGRPAQSGDSNLIYEAFKPDTVPTGAEMDVLDNGMTTDIDPSGVDAANAPTLPAADSEIGGPLAAAPPPPAAKPPAPQPEAGGLY